MNEPIEVVRADVVVDGHISSEFRGFASDARFEFNNGQVWEQTESKYSYHCAHRPSAIVVNGMNGYQLSVDGMSETVRVRRVL